jgi:hypothetical protein
LSEDGFGLSKVDRIAPDELISVAMPDGHILEGRVVWAKDSRSRAGVALISRSQGTIRVVPASKVRASAKAWVGDPDSHISKSASSPTMDFG